MEQLNDVVLVKMASNGDRQAFDKLMVKHVGKMKGQIKRQAYGFMDHHDDILNVTMMRVWEKMGSWEGRSQFSTWLYRVVFTCTARYMRSLIRDINRFITDGTMTISDELVMVPNSIESLETPQQVVETMQYAECLASAFDKLSNIEKEVIELREVELMDMDQMAEAIGVSQGTIKSRLHRARSKINTYMAEYMGPDFIPIQPTSTHVNRISAKLV